VPGKSRWVTTSIARFDPDLDWPTDLDCQLVWSAQLISYDGKLESLPRSCLPDTAACSSPTRHVRCLATYHDHPGYAGGQRLHARYLAITNACLIQAHKTAVSLCA
jgi:hypothetical protein